MLLFSYLFYSSTQRNNYKQDINKIINFNNINFAGEKVEFDNKYYFNREKFEKELSIARYNVYQFVLYHKREPLFFPIIEKKLKESGIPDDFKYLAVAESSLKNNALSDANAGGIWQFIPDTAKRFNLSITDKIDERYNFEKETDAAITYLKKIHEDLKNRTLTAAAYNRGENGIARALEDQKVKSYYDLYLNSETSRYIWRILAIKYLMINRYKIFEPGELGDQFLPPKTKEIKLSGEINLKEWANKNSKIFADIKNLNPWIIGDSLPEGEFIIKVLDY